MATTVYYIVSLLVTFIAYGIAFVWGYATLTQRVAVVESSLQKLEDSRERLARVETNIENIKTMLTEIRRALTETGNYDRASRHPAE